MAWAPLVGIGASILADRLFSDDKMKKVPTMTKPQQALLNQLLQLLGGGGLQKGFGEATDLQRQLMDPSSEAVQQFADPYRREFEQQTIPGLAERFAGMNAMGSGLMTSGFGQALGGAAANLQSQLAALKAGLGQQAAGQLMGQYGGMLGMGLGAQPFAYQQQAPSMTGGLISSWGKAGFPMPGMGG